MSQDLITIQEAAFQNYRQDYSYDNALQYAMLSGEPPNLVEMHYPVVCKDFLSDVFWSERRKRAIEIYFFTWKPGRLNVDQPSYWLGLKHKRKDLHGNRERLAEFLHKWEEVLSYPKSEVRLADKGQLAVKFDAKWAHKPSAMSFFTLALRIGMQCPSTPDLLEALGKITDKSNPYGPYDHSFVFDLLEKGRFQTILTKRCIPYGKGYEHYGTEKDCHMYSGIIGTHDIEGQP